MLNNNEFTIHDLPDDKRPYYPIRAILVPNKGYDDSLIDVKSLKNISEKDLCNIKSKQIFW